MILMVIGIICIFVGVLTLGIGVIAWPIILAVAIAYIAYRMGSKKKGGDKE